MNLHGIVSGAITAVNPFVPVTIKRSSGYTTLANGNRIPAYTAVANVSVQVQSLTYSDIQKLDGLNIEGVRRAIYLPGEAEAIVRSSGEGGDLIVFAAGQLPEGNTWLLAQVLEAWPDWRKVAITLQTDL